MAITDAKIQVGFPAGAYGIRKSDDTLPTIRYVPAGPSLVPNGDFETNTSGWSALNGATLTRDTGTYKVGAASMKVARGSADAAAQISPDMTVVGGVTYYVAAHVNRATAPSAKLQINFYDKDAVNLLAHDVTIDRGTTWVHATSSVAAPPGAVTANITLYVTTSGHAFFDAIEFQPCVPLVESPYTEPTATGNFAGGALRHEIAADAYHASDVKVFDMGTQTSGTLADASYTRVYGARHKWTGDVLVDNGVVRLWVKVGYSVATAGGAVRASCYVHGAWQTVFNLIPDTGGNKAAPVARVRFLALSRAMVRLEATDELGNTATYTVRRGHHAIQVDVKRVKDGGANLMDFQAGKATRFAAYNGNVVLQDETINGSTFNVAGSSLTEPYAIAWDPAFPYLVVVGMTNKPTNLYAATTDDRLRWRLDAAATSALKRTFWVTLIPFPAVMNGVMFVEAESMTLDGGAATSAEGGTSGGSVVLLDANAEGCLHNFRPGFDLPLGEYTLVAFAKDANQVANDFRLQVENTTDVTQLGLATKTLTASYAWYTLDFAITSADQGDECYFRVSKATATANTIRVDYLLLIPRKRNSGTPAHVFFPRDLARNAMMATTARETVRGA